MTTALDGIYQVSSTSNYDGPLVKRSDGITEIRNGTTSRRDGNNVLWTSTFHILSDTGSGNGIRGRPRRQAWGC